jgi:uncharacterized Zn-binding protein involved in type VI secretion
MPGFLLHLGATVMCAHGGQAQPTAPQPSVLVSGQPVVTLGAPYVVAGCAFPPPPAANGPCITGQFVDGATRVFVEGMPVLLLDSQAICAPTGTPLIVAVTQVRVSGV